MYNLQVNGCGLRSLPLIIGVCLPSQHVDAYRYDPESVFDSINNSIWDDRPLNCFGLGMDSESLREVCCVSLMDGEGHGLKEVRVQAWESDIHHRRSSLLKASLRTLKAGINSTNSQYGQKIYANIIKKRIYTCYYSRSPITIFHNIVIVYTQ